MRFAHPNGYGDPDLEGTPYLYVFRANRAAAGADGSPIAFERYRVDDQSGAGRQLSVGYIDAGGTVDICIGSKLGLFVFLQNPGAPGAPEP